MSPIICPICQKDHQQQRIDFPIGALVSASALLNGEPLTLRGYVLGHRQDGRAVVEVKVNSVSTVLSFCDMSLD